MDLPQVNYQEQPTVFDKLMEPVQPFIEKQSQQLTPHHLEKFSYQEFFRLLVFYFVSDIPSISLLIKTYFKKQLLSPTLRLRNVPYSTFKDAFERFSPDLFKAAFIFLLSTLSLKAIPELADLGILYCIDGSLFPILSSMVWAAYKENCQAARLHLCFELNRMIPVSILVGSGNSSERDALRQMLTAMVTFIADRGYQCFKLFHDILQAQAHFVFRVKDNLVYNVQKSLIVQLPQSVQNLFQEVTDQLIQCKNDPYGHTYRLVCFRVGTEHFFLLTDRLDLTTFQVILLYAYRWQVELIFRFLKRTMRGIHMINHSESGATIQFYVLLIVALLELYLKQQTMIQQEEKEQNMEKDSQNQSQKDDISTPGSEPQIEKTDKISSEGISHPYQFFHMIGEKLEKYWKIGIHWLSALRCILHNPFDEQAIAILATP